MKKRNGEIEFFRFVFALMIWLRHGAKLFVGDWQDLFFRGALAVDFFFMVSGYLMAASCVKKYREDSGKCEIGKETAAFIKRKYLGLMPEFLIAWMIAFVLYMIGLDEISPVIFLKEGIDWLFEIIPLSMTGITNGAFHNASWYISAMLLAMAVLYPVCRKHYEFFVNVMAPLAAVFVLGFFAVNYSTTLNPKILIASFLYKGVLRGIGMISFGAALYPMTEKIGELKWNETGRKLISVVIAGCMTFILAVMIFRSGPDLDIFAVCLMGPVVCLAFSGQSQFASVFDHRLCYFLGRKSMLLYLCHSEVSRFIKIVYKRMLEAGTVTVSPNMCSLIMWGMYIVLTILTMFAVQRISDLLRKNRDKIYGMIFRQDIS